MKSIFSTFKVNDAKTGKPIDLIGTMQIAFDKASLSKKTMWEEMYVDKWFEYRPAQLGLTAEGIMGKYHVRIRASITVIMLILRFVRAEALNSGQVKFHAWGTSL